MRNTWLIIQREYLERIRTKAFLLSTILMPLFMAGVIVGPAKLASMKSGSVRNVVVVASSQAVADAAKSELENIQNKAEKKMMQGRDVDAAPKYVVETQVGPTDELRNQLTERVRTGKLDGYIWVSDDDLAQKKFTYSTKHSSDFIDISSVQNSVNAALVRARLVSSGVQVERVEDIVGRADMDVIRIDKTGKESKAGGMAAVMLPFVLMFMIYLSVLIYGVSVMRSVLQEKSSRVMEVMLSSANATQLMAGKILGVGAVGATQMLIWVTCGLVASAPGLVAAQPYLKDIQLPAMVYVCFPLFFILGYLLYSTMYAAVGAMVNSEEEAQQVQWPVLLPLIMCSVFAMSVIREPNSQLAFWASMFPLTSPVIMFVRIIVQQPPIWQIALSVVLLIAGMLGMVWICSRIYRVGILMYGKRPTLPEIVKWIKYA